MFSPTSFSNRLTSSGMWPVIFAVALLAFAALPIFAAPLAKFYLGVSIYSYFQVFYGIIATGVIIFLILQKMRKGVFEFRLGTMRSWFMAHIYIGLICIIIIYIHSGFYLKPNFSGLLFLLFSIVWLSGIIGALIYKTVPLFFAKDGKEVLEKEEVIAHISKCLDDADQSISNTGQDFQKIYHEKIRPLLTHKRTKWHYLLFDEIELNRREKAALIELKKIVPDDEVAELEFLGPIFIEKENLEFKWARLRFLRIWLNFHMPLAFTLLTATAIHILSIWYF